MSNFEKSVKLGIITKEEKGYRISDKWQKLLFNELEKAAKKWHEDGRKGDLNWFDGVEKLITKHFPKLDPLIQIEIAYYAYAVANESLKGSIKK